MGDVIRWCTEFEVEYLRHSLSTRRGNIFLSLPLLATCPTTPPFNNEIKMIAKMHVTCRKQSLGQAWGMRLVSSSLEQGVLACLPGKGRKLVETEQGNHHSQIMPKAPPLLDALMSWVDRDSPSIPKLLHSITCKLRTSETQGTLRSQIQRLESLILSLLLSMLTSKANQFSSTEYGLVAP